MKKKLLPNTIVLSCDRLVRYGVMNIIYLDTFWQFTKQFTTGNEDKRILLYRATLVWRSFDFVAKLVEADRD